jgi:carboxylesterase type B
MASPSISHAAAFRLVLTLFVVIAHAAAAQSRPDPLAQTNAGSVAGIGTDIVAFKGIPYAAPPIGPLRWRAPQPPVPWSGVREATRFGDDCVQMPYVIATGQKTSEDCLTVNVWTPGVGHAALRPVMVFIYGGAFVGGSSAYPLYDGAKLAADGVVVVSFNYRVGIFGFFAHPMLSAESAQHVSGNYGLLDQIAALKWVQANIAGFGGDPRRVTVFGESAGAVSIAVLMTSTLAKGLFERAILQSPTVPLLADLAAAERSGDSLGDDLVALRRLSAEQLLTHNSDFSPRSGRNLLPSTFPAPIVDGFVVPSQPRKAFGEAGATFMPTLVGTNEDEGRMFVDEQTPVSVESYQAWVQQQFGACASDILRLNPAVSDTAARAAMSSVVGDGTFGESSRMIARGVSRHQPRTFSYLFTRSVHGRPPPPTHSEDLPFVFGSLDQPSFIQHPPPEQWDWKLSRTIMGAWVRFAATGDPNGPGMPRWPRYDGRTDPYLEFGDSIRPRRAHRKAQLDAVERFYSGDEHQ